MIPSSPYLRSSLVNEANSRPAEAGRLMDETVTLLRNARLTYHEAVREFKRRWIEQELDASNNNQVRTARVLCMHRNTLTRAMGELKIVRPNRAGRKKGLSRKRDETMAGARPRAVTGTHSSGCHSSYSGGQDAGYVNSVSKGGLAESPELSAAASTAHLASAQVAADKSSPPAASLAVSAGPLRSAGEPQPDLAAGVGEAV